MCTVVAECYELLTLSAVRRDGESEDAWKARQARALAEVDSRLLVLFHALVQARLARSQAHRVGQSPRAGRCLFAKTLDGGVVLVLSHVLLQARPWCPCGHTLGRRSLQG